MTEEEKGSHFKPNMGTSTVKCYQQDIRYFEVTEAMKKREDYLNCM
jgi:hypothetical protein